MSKFSDLLSKPLPSAANKVVEESVVPEIDDNCVPPCKTLGAPAIADPIGADPLADPVVEPVSAPLVANDAPVTPVDADDLTPDESQRVDDTMNAVATPILIKNELTEEEVEDFVESVDADIAMKEGLYTERTIVKFDKNAKKAQLYEVAVAACAREKKDPLYKKLQTVYKMERIIKAKLRKKYNAPAQKKVKEYLARAKKSKSGIIARIANKIAGK